MKKLLLSIFTLICLGAFAQKDLMVSVDSPLTGSTIYKGQSFNLVVTFKNNATIDIPATDSVLFGLYINTVLSYSTQIIHGGITAGQSKKISIPLVFNNLTADVNGANFCGIGYLRYSGNLDSNLANNQSCIVINLKLVNGVEELAAAKSVKLYPIPARDFLNITMDYSETAKMNIIDITGRLVKSIIIDNGNAKIDLSSLNKGLYLYEITGENGSPIKSGKFTVTQ